MLQLRRNRIGVAIGEHHHDALSVQPQQLEHSNGAALGRQPGTPLPMPQGQGGDIAGELGMGERGRIGTAETEQLVTGEARKAGEIGGQVVRHVNGV